MDGSLDTSKPTLDLASYARRQHAFEQLEGQITELWGHLNAATFRFLVLVAEFDRSKCYERQVRAMTRVATAANEAVLVSVALHGTAAHVEKLVRKYCWVERAEAAQRVQVQHENRGLHYFFDEAGMLILQGRLPPEVGAVVRKALDAAVEDVRAIEHEGADASAETSAFEREQTAAASRADALALLAERFLEHRGDDDSGSTADRYQVVVHVDQAVLTQAVAADHQEPHCCELDDGPALALDTARRLACDATLVGITQTRDGEPLDIGRRTRAIPPALARALRSRDGGCRFPGCTRTRFTEGHHVKHWADGGETRLGNLVTLCRFHHRLVHEGGFGLRVTDDGVFVFTRPDGTRVAENGERSFRGSVVVAREPDDSQATACSLCATARPDPRHGAFVSEPVSFEAHVELLEFFLAQRAAVVERIQQLLNAQHKPPRYLQDRQQLALDFEACFFAPLDLGADQARLKGQLEAAHWARGFKPRDMREMPNDLLQPADLMVRAFVMWAHTHWPSRKARVRHAHIFFNLYLVRQLALLAMRTWDAGSDSAAERLSQAQRVLDAVWRATPADQPVLVRDVRWLIPVAMSPTTDDLAPYFEVAEEIGATFAEGDRLEILSATVRIAGGHLRSYLQYYVVQKGVPLGESSLVLLTRKSNALDFSLLIHGLVALLGGYERAVESGDSAKRLQLADAICQGVSPDPELFINRVDLLAAYTMVEHLFTTTDQEGRAAYTPLGRRHVQLLEEYKARIGRLAKPLYDDCRKFKPADGTYSPYGVLYGVATNVLEHIVFKALQRDDAAPFGLEDVFVAGGADKLAWVAGWRKLPHVDRSVQRQYAFPFELAEALFARVEHALHTRATEGEASAAVRDGRLHVVAADDVGAQSNPAAIPDLPVRYVGSSDIRVVAAGKATARDNEQIADARAEGHLAVSYETPGGSVAISKDFLTEVLGAGHDIKVVGLPGAAAERLRLMCGVLVAR